MHDYIKDRGSIHEKSTSCRLSLDKPIFLFNTVHFDSFPYHSRELTVYQFLAQGTQDPYMHARKAVSEAISGAAKYEWKDPEAKKLLDLTMRNLNQVRPPEDSLATIEEVDEEDIRASEGAQEAKKKEELKRKMAEWTAQLNAAALKARSGKR